MESKEKEILNVVIAVLDYVKKLLESRRYAIEKKDSEVKVYE